MSMREKYQKLGPASGPKAWDLICDVLAQHYNDEAKTRVLAALADQPEGKYDPTGETSPKTARKPKSALEDGEAEYVRPNGEIYYTRKWGGVTDVIALRKARQHNFFPILMGSPGCGKTALLDAAFPDNITIVGDVDTSTEDMVGQYVRDATGDYIWHNGGLLTAAIDGLVYYIDEVGLIDPKLMSKVYALMDGRRELFVTQNPDLGTVHAHPDFFVVAATNPNAPGVRLSEALLSRFTIHVEMETDYALATKLGVNSDIVDIAMKMEAMRKETSHFTWTPQMRELLAFRDIAAVYGNKWAIENLIASAPEIDREKVADMYSRALGEDYKAAVI